MCFYYCDKNVIHNIFFSYYYNDWNYVMIWDTD